MVCTVHTWTQQLLTQLAAAPFQSLCTPALSLHALVIRHIRCHQTAGHQRQSLQRLYSLGVWHRLLAGGETGWREEFRTPSPTFHMSVLTVPPSVQEKLAADLTPLVPALGRTRWDSEKVGLIAFALDGEPLLGPLVQLPGLYVGCAFHSGGFAYNPAAGLLLAEFVADGRTQIDISAFAPDRFSPSKVADYLATTVVQDAALRRRH